MLSILGAMGNAQGGAVAFRFVLWCLAATGMALLAVAQGRSDLWCEWRWRVARGDDACELLHWLASLLVERK